MSNRWNTLARNAVAGHLLGDAIGVSYEFGPPEPLFALEAASLHVGPTRFAHGKKVFRHWSDDGSLTLALVDAIPVSGSMHQLVERTMANMRRWLHGGLYSGGAGVFDVGNTTLASLMYGPNSNAGARSQLGNGAMMRVLPLAFARGPQAKVVDILADVEAVSSLTHPDPISVAACQIYVLAAFFAATGLVSPWDDACLVVRESSPAETVAALAEEPNRPSGSGYVLDSLAFARMVMRNRPSWRETVRGAIALGGDTDTTAAIGAGLAAIWSPPPQDELHYLHGWISDAIPIIDRLGWTTPHDNHDLKVRNAMGGTNES